jgi:hypothetical protein
MLFESKQVREAMHLEDAFDSVIMLTWSNWATEPRSNRYHYATRFARELPVFFVQPNQATAEILVEDSGHDGITIVNCGAEYGRQQEDSLIDYLRANGCKRPLVWIYNSNFEGMLDRLESAYWIFHATEDYTDTTSSLTFTNAELIEKTVRVIDRSDLLICVSQAVLDRYLKVIKPNRPTLALNNGCDFSFWYDEEKSKNGPVAGQRPIAFFQGGVNLRVDYDLLHDLIVSMPDWDFWFAGAEDSRPEVSGRMAMWRAIKGLPNVTFFGRLAIEDVRDYTYKASVGLVPFIQERLMKISLPLKAYEYVAAGLPVVSSPIDALSNQEVFDVQDSAAGFEAALRRALPTRLDETALVARKAAAKAMDYDVRFDEMKQVVMTHVNDLYARPKLGLNILVLYCDQYTHIKTIEENLKAFSNYSKHNYFYFAASDYPGWNMFSQFKEAWPQSLDLSFYDAIIWHYGMPASLAEYFSLTAGEQLTRYDGLKILFIQDEYENTRTIDDWIEKAGIQLVMTCVPPEGVNYVYPKAHAGKTEFIQTLTGFVPDPAPLARHALPMRQRDTRIGYRGRILPYHYGSLGWEKYQIGLQMREKAAERGVKVDIEVDDAKRIYGDGWYEFLGSVRATLGTESGANVFDFDGTLKQKAAEAREAGVPYETFFEEHIKEREGHVRMNQVSPKFFEAIILRTALICFEGTYSGVIKPNLHYIPLAKDFSNLDDVLAKLEDFDFLEELTDRAYKDIVESGNYSYEKFIGSLDSIIEQRTLHPARTEIISAPMAVRRRHDQDFSVLIQKDPMELALNTGVLRQPFRRQEVVQATQRVRERLRDDSPIAAIGNKSSVIKTPFT